MHDKILHTDAAGRETAYIYPPQYPHPFWEACRDIVISSGYDLTDIPDPRNSFRVAPLLRRKIPASELATSGAGTLIFHPSPLPAFAGRDAIKWGHSLGVRVWGVTWFWASGGLDSGDICEQECFEIPASATPKEIYESLCAPAGIRALERAIQRRGRFPQGTTGATYYPPFPKK